MPPRKSNREAAVSARSAIAASVSLDAQPVVTPRRGRQPKGDKRPAAPRHSHPVESDVEEIATPVRRSQAAAKASVAAPPDTLGLLRRARPAVSAAAKPASPTRSPPKRAAPAASRAGTTRGRGRAKGTAKSAAEAEFAATVKGMSHDDFDSPDERVVLDTPTKTLTESSPLLYTRTRPPPAADFSADIVNSSPEMSPNVKRGRKRKSEVEDLAPLSPKEPVKEPERPPAKRGRPKRASTADTNRIEAPSTPTTRQKTTPTRGDIFVDIISPSKFETSRQKISAAKRPAAPLPDMPPSTGEDAKWRKKYEDLFALRQTEPEKEYEELRKSAQSRFDAADALIESLRAKLADATTRSAAKNKPKNGEASTNGSAAQPPPKSAAEMELEKQLILMQQQIEALVQDGLVKDEAIEHLEQHRKQTETTTDYNLREALKLMQELSGLTIDDVVAEDDGLSYMCRQSVPNATVSYKLTVSDDYPDEYQYAPGTTTSTQVSDALPEYLQDSIAFEKSSAAMFFWRMCDHLHQRFGSNPTEDQSELLEDQPPQAGGEQPSNS